tara:strand:+ start:1343 stop:2326 length:984 start_codon:yes stop_codon:yes gene_type:complete
MAVGVLGVWVSALAVPVIAHDAGGANLLVACAVVQFVGTLIGGRFPLDMLFVATACACAAITAFPGPGVVAFGLSFGALFRRYLDCVWEPVRAARLEFSGQVVAACLFVPFAASGAAGDGWEPVLCTAAVAAASVSIAVRADPRDTPDAPAPGRILYAYGLVCAGVASFSLGGILVIANSESDWSGSQSTIFATATLLVGATAAAIVSGYDWPTPAIRFRLGCYICSTTAILSMWARSLDGYLVMSVAFGLGAGLVLINARNVCFNNSNVFFILSQRLSDCIPPLLLAMGATPRELMQAAPTFISLGLMLLPTNIDRVATIALAQIR